MLFGANNTCYIHQVRSRGSLQVTRKSNSPRNPAIDEDEDEEPEVKHVGTCCFAVFLVLLLSHIFATKGPWNMFNEFFLLDIQ